MIAEVKQKALSFFAPPKALKVSEHADEYRRLSPEASPEPGRWNTDRAPYQREIMDAFNDPDVHTVVMMSSAQVGKSEIVLNLMLYFAEHDPSPMLIVQPTLDIAEAFSKDRAATMVRDTPVLSGIIADAKSRDSGNTLLHKKFPGGHWTLAGANSPTGLRSRPVRIVLFDEVDGYLDSAGADGDPVTLGVKRTNNFWNRKIGLFSTPTIKGMSRIEAAYEESDKRKCYVPCPHCGHEQTLEWERVVYDDGKPETAAYACEKCGVLIEESHKLEMLSQKQWVATAEFKGIAGFHINELYSPWKKWSEVVEDYLKAKGNPEREKAWWNTSMGLSWEDKDGELLVADVLQARRESWRELMLPAETVLLTAGVDVQDDRLEAVLLGWAQNGQCLSAARRVFEGSPAFPQVWQTLDEWLLAERQTETGGFLKIRAACVDSGGHHTNEVYTFCTARYGRDIYAIKGVDGPKPIWPDRASKSRKYRGHKVWRIGVDTVKDMLRARLAVVEGPGRIRFAADLSPEFFEQLTVERRVVKYDRRGRPVRSWVKKSGARNEAWDCMVYGFAALEALQRLKFVKLATVSPPAPREPQPEKKAARRERRVKRRSFGVKR
ncbi:phage terminase large subunit family protein [Prosthecochloris sp.]|uniref:phage terminase large subunit family protein n=1 Tax=Prosthecochloris sp. TaxID=290513 RepID=UPI0025F520F3|nr:phage terminase large subunit family protein [Prosthecochloris sp.]